VPPPPSATSGFSLRQELGHRLFVRHLTRAARSDPLAVSGEFGLDLSLIRYVIIRSDIRLCGHGTTLRPPGDTAEANSPADEADLQDARVLTGCAVLDSTSRWLYRYTIIIVLRHDGRRLMFRFRLDGSSGVPPYLQLVHQVRQSLLLGYLQEGDRLPTVKEVASDLAINPNTVVKAYRQLEHEGLASGRPGQGTFITATSSPELPEAQEALRASLEEWLRTAEEAGLDDDAVTALIAVARQDMRKERV
jgi:GntR family transcriptional regulator